MIECGTFGINLNGHEDPSGVYLPLAGGTMTGDIKMSQQTSITNIAGDFGTLYGLNTPVSTDELLLLGYLSLTPPVTGTTSQLLIGGSALGVQDMFQVYQDYDNDTETYLSLGTNGVVIRHNDDSGASDIKSYVQCKENVIIESTTLTGSPDGNVTLKARNEDFNGEYSQILLNPNNGIQTAIYTGTNTFYPLTIDSSGVVMKTVGNLSTDTVSIQNNSGNPIVELSGDKNARFYGQVGINSAPSSTINVYLTGNSSAYGYYASGSYTQSAFCSIPNSATTRHSYYAPNCGFESAYKAENSGGGATYTSNRVGYSAGSFGNSSFDNIGFYADISNGGSGNAYAIHIVNGGIKLPSGATGFSGTGAYTNFTIENGIITSAS